MNSFRGVENALTLVFAELCRQLDEHEPIRQVTWGFNLDTQKIFTMRVKEDANDYRYFPEPDLPAVATSRELVEQIRAALPELPAAKSERLRRDYGLTDYETELLTADKNLADYFEIVAKKSGAAKEAANWILNDVARTLKEKNLEVKDLPVAPDALAEIIAQTSAKKINVPTARKIFAQIIAGDQRRVEEIIAQDNLAQVNDSGAILAALDAAIAKNPTAEAEVRSGKTATAMWFVGQIMGQMKGKADPAAVTQAICDRFGIPPEALAKKRK
jgi:aspartyl-tRNA(Asn)/glutamyl-tRNA(Gln) amidotransferase subunit B